MILAVTPFGLAASEASANCLTLASGPVVLDVVGCKALEPERDFDVTKEKYKFIADLDAAGKKQFMDSYRGLFLRGKVVKSQISTKGLTAEQGVLSGETTYFYLPPGQMQCAAINGKRVGANLKETCCNGSGDIPCLLGTGYVLSAPNVVGAAGSSAGDDARNRAKKSADVQKGDKAFNAKQYKAAAKAYEAARTAGDLDISGHYRLGYAYRELDQCRDAIGPLKHIYQKAQEKQVWADEEKTARQATFLLARCYSKMNDPGASVLILNGYLLESSKYKSELKESLAHKDFGWIHTSKEYRDYKKAAQKKLK